MTIRTQLLPGDLSFLISSHTDFYVREHGYTDKFEYYVAKSAVEFYEAYQPEESRIWIVEEDKGLRVGSLVLQHRGTAAQLRYFLLLPAAQGQGVGGRLLSMFQAYCQEKGYSSAYLWTTAEQEVAGRLYQSRGFQLVEEKPSEAFGKPLVEQRYVWKVH